MGIPLVDHVEKGYNASLLAYGQTGSGKTFTMTGDLSRDSGLVRIRVQEHTHTSIGTPGSMCMAGKLAAYIYSWAIYGIMIDVPFCSVLRRPVLN